MRQFVAEALLADDAPENRRFRIDPETLAPEAVYRFCESPDADTRKLGMQIIRRSPRLQVPEETVPADGEPDRLVRGFVIRSLWALYRDRGVTADWKPPVPPRSRSAPPAKKAAAQPEPRGPGVPHRPEQAAGQPDRVCPRSCDGCCSRFRRAARGRRPPDAAEATQRLKPLPARRAKLELVEVMRDLALEDAAFAAGVLPLLEEFMTSRGQSERAACLVAVTRIRHTHTALRSGNGEVTPMSTDKYFTYRGDVRAIAVLGGGLAFVTVHPEGQPTAVYRLDPEKLTLAERCAAGRRTGAAGDG